MPRTLGNINNNNPNNNNVDFYKCLRCNKIITAAEYDSHTCHIDTKDYKNEEFDYYVISKDALGREKILLKSMDGVLYTFVKREKKESDKEPYVLPSSFSSSSSPAGT